MSSVHPHVCGVYGCLTETCFDYAVHPHVCGVYLLSNLLKLHLQRFIPTCVGFTRCLSTPSRTATGSSPRVWGLRRKPWGEQSPLRFIPTCVGFTWHFPGYGIGNLVHPHVCGVYAPDLTDTLVYFRFIPTCVGFT